MNDWRDRIVSNPNILHGKPCFKNTRIPAALVLGFLAEGNDVKRIIEELPDLTPEDIFAALSYARDLATFETVSETVSIE